MLADQMVVTVFQYLNVQEEILEPILDIVEYAFYIFYLHAPFQHYKSTRT